MGLRRTVCHFAIQLPWSAAARVRGNPANEGHGAPGSSSTSAVALYQQLKALQTHINNTCLDSYISEQLYFLHV